MTSIDDVMIEITPQVLLKAYACGIFPMAESAEDNALYWIEPERRGILPLETSQPGVFTIGDVRAGSTKRVAAAVGEGAVIVAQIHSVLAAE